MKKIIIFSSLILLTQWAFSQGVIAPACPTDKTLSEITILETVVPPIPPPPPPANPPEVDTTTRLVWWVHGLNGDAGSWGPAMEGVYDSFKVQNVALEFSSTLSDAIRSAADSMNSQLTTIGNSLSSEYDVNNAVIIGHSLGGIVSRLAEQNEADALHKYGAIVTFGTPHDGAMIMRNFGDVLRMVSDGCRHLGNTGLSFLALAAPIVDIIADKKGREQVDKLCEIKADGSGALTKFLGTFSSSAYTPQMILQLAYQSNLIRQMNENGHPGMENNIAFHSKEDGPEFYRLMYHLINAPSKFPKWQANYDEGILEIAENLLKPGIALLAAAVESRITIMETSGLDCDSWWEWVNPTCIISRPIYLGLRKDRTTLNDAKNWLHNVPETWKDIIGGQRVTQQVVTHYNCSCLYYPPGATTPSVINYQVSQPSQCQYQNAITCNASPVYQTQTVIQRESNSDGVVTVSSQMAFPGAYPHKMHTGLEFNPITLQWEIADGNNHMQERNSLSTKGTLMRLFNGDYRRFYETPKQP